MKQPYRTVARFVSAVARQEAQEAGMLKAEAQALSTQIDARLGELRAEQPHDWMAQLAAVEGLMTRRDLLARQARVQHNKAERAAFAVRMGVGNVDGWLEIGT